MQAEMDDKVVYLRLHWKMVQLLTEFSPDTYQQYTNPVPEIARGTGCDLKGRILDLGDVIRHTLQKGIHNQSIKFVCCEQRYTWRTVHYPMAYWWSKDLPYEEQVGWFNFVSPRWRIGKAPLTKARGKVHNHLCRLLMFRSICRCLCRITSNP